MGTKGEVAKCGKCVLGYTGNMRTPSPGHMQDGLSRCVECNGTGEVVCPGCDRGVVDALGPTIVTCPVHYKESDVIVPPGMVSKVLEHTPALDRQIRETLNPGVAFAD